jgi:hypothetical protein
MASESGSVKQVKPFVELLKKRGFAPAHIELATWNDWTLVSCFDEARSKFISEGVAMGIDMNPEVALMKGLTEYCERKLTADCDDPIAFLTKRSNGFAAFPLVSMESRSARSRARENALNEAVERFLWASWWDGDDVQFEVKDPNDQFLLPSLKQLKAEFDLLSVKEVRVQDITKAKTLSILVAHTKSDGFVTGGAASDSSQIERRLVPAFGELLRHLVVLRKMTSSDSQMSFYEKRLNGFGMGLWSDLVKSRLQRDGSRAVHLPCLIADREVEHQAMDVVSIHRCLFDGQPEFMGGKLERLCI